MIASDPVSLLIDRLEGVKGCGGGRFSGCCPAHDDRSASLSITSGDDGRALVKCHAGCTAADIVAAVGLKLSDLMVRDSYYNGNGHHRYNGTPQPTPKVAEAEKKPKPKTKPGKLLATFDYEDAEGKLLYQVRKYESVDESGNALPGDKTFRQFHPDGQCGWIAGRGDGPLVPYRLNELIHGNRIVLVLEGEKDVDAAIELGFNATTNVGGACKWLDSYSEYLIDRDVVVIGDNDDRGRDHVKQVTRSAYGKAASVRVLELPNLPAKGDLSDWIEQSFGDAAEPDDIRNALVDLIFACPEWEPPRMEDLTPDEYRDVVEESERETLPPIAKFSVSDLCDQFPTLHKPTIDGLAREGETLNIIAPTKVGKSWFGYGLLLSMASGREWLDKYQTCGGRCLLVDNELHVPTLASRIRCVAEAMRLERHEYADHLDVWSLRGNLRTLPQLMREFDGIQRGQYSLILLDARYRFADGTSSENSNDDNREFYNLADRLAAQTGATIAMIHHSTKGVQSEKRVTDVGAGGGSQSRAADTHLVLREHVDDGAVVLDAAVRSFPPIAPQVLRWNWPLWMVDDSADPAELKGSKGPQKEQEERRDAEGMKLIVKALANGTRATRSQLRTKTGMGPDRVNKLVVKMLEEGHLASEEVTIKGNLTDEFWLSDTTE